MMKSQGRVWNYWLMDFHHRRVRSVCCFSRPPLIGSLGPAIARSTIFGVSVSNWRDEAPWGWFRRKATESIDRNRRSPLLEVADGKWWADVRSPRKRDGVVDWWEKEVLGLKERKKIEPRKTQEGGLKILLSGLETPVRSILSLFFTYSLPQKGL